MYISGKPLIVIPFDYYSNHGYYILVGERISMHMIDDLYTELKNSRKFNHF